MVGSSRRHVVAFGAALVLGTWLGCRIQDEGHCHNRQGNETCAKRGDEFRFCSKCVGEREGCVEQVDDRCYSPFGSGGTTTQTSTSSETGSTTGTGTTGGQTSSEDTSTSTTATESETSTGTTVSTETSSATTMTGSTGSDSSTGMTTSTDGTATGGSVCGNGIAEDGEICDGMDLRDATCIDFGYGGGMLACSGNCQAIDEANCCQGIGGDCLLLGPCCPTLSCVVNKCQQ